MVRGVLDFGRRAGTTFTQNVGEYLQEEGRDLPTRPEMNEFLEAVDRLRDDVERAEAKLVLLERRGRP
jgi:ubiquinone biosynthesis protein UbiJ